MTIASNKNTPRNTYTATAGQTAFTIGFEFFKVADVKVFKNGTLLTYKLILNCNLLTYKLITIFCLLMEGLANNGKSKTVIQFLQTQFTPATIAPQAS